MNKSGEKSFKQLWRDLRKEGWKARKPTGIAKDHRYVKPGIKGRLDESRRGLDFFEGEKELMAFGRLSGILDHHPPSAPMGSAVRRPVGKQAAHAAIGLDPPCVPSPTTNQASVATASRGLVTNVALSNSRPDYTPTVAAIATAVESRVNGPAGTTDATEQGGGVEDVVLDDTELHPRENVADEEEGKSESDDPNVSEDFVDLDVFDSDNFMEGIRKEPLFGPTAEDDVNLVDSADFNDSDSDADDDGILEDNDLTSPFIEGVNDVEDVPMTEDVPEAELFGLTVDQLRDIAGNGWVTYDEAHSGEFQIDAAADYYDGEFGPTRSAVAYADSPLGMFFYFLPKELWSHIAKETNRYRTQNITVIATSRRNKLLARQAKDPRISVPDLVDIEEGLKKFKDIQPHEIVHVVALLFARAISPIRDGLAKHWSTDEDGAVPRGTFSRFMKRDRFVAILKFLHFNNNEQGGVRADAAWKVRPLLQAVEKTFRRRESNLF